MIIILNIQVILLEIVMIKKMKKKLIKKLREKTQSKLNKSSKRRDSKAKASKAKKDENKEAMSEPVWAAAIAIRNAIPLASVVGCCGAAVPVWTGAAVAMTTRS